MGYLHIENLYANKTILMFRECFALEKIHGTSAHIEYNPTRSGAKLTYFSGGEKYENFRALFDSEKLETYMTEHFPMGITVYGEAYGGRQQGMKATYGDKMRFIAFDVKVGDNWLNVPTAEKVATALGLEFVHYELTTTDIEALDKLRDAPSVQAVRNGCGNDKEREGVVLRPLIELQKNNGDRIIAKHKGEKFQEQKHVPKIGADPVVYAGSEAIADEFVTEMRLNHVLDKLPDATDITKTKLVIDAMVEDVIRESKGQIVESVGAVNAIKRKCAAMFKARVTKLT